MENSRTRLIILFGLIKSKYRTCYEAADVLGIPNYQLSLILNGRRKLSDDLICKLEIIFECDRSVFLPRERMNHGLR